MLRERLGTYVIAMWLLSPESIEVDLLEVSLVAFPANELALVTAVKAVEEEAPVEVVEGPKAEDLQKEIETLKG